MGALAADCVGVARGVAPRGFDAGSRGVVPAPDGALHCGSDTMLGEAAAIGAAAEIPDGAGEAGVARVGAAGVFDGTVGADGAPAGGAVVALVVARSIAGAGTGEVKLPLAAGAEAIAVDPAVEAGAAPGAGGIGAAAVDGAGTIPAAGAGGTGAAAGGNGDDMGGCSAGG